MIPKYETIAADIQRSIEDGSFNPGDKLPTVVELCDFYAASKVTIRRAIEKVTELGLVTSRRGSGTYVKESQVFGGQDFLTRKSDRAAGFSQAHRDQNVSSVVYDFKIVNPAPDIAKKLGIEADDFTYYICRVRQLNDVPIVIEYTYMPLSVIPGLKKKELYSSIYSYIQETLGLKISSFHRTIRAVGATAEEANQLDVTIHEPLLEFEQIGFLDSGTTFEYSISRNVGSRYELHNVTLA